MMTRAEIKMPTLAAFGPPVWAYKPVQIMGVEIAAAVVAAVIGTVMLLVPVLLAFTIGGELDAAHSRQFSQAPPSSPFMPSVQADALVPANFQR